MWPMLLYLLLYPPVEQKPKAIFVRLVFVYLFWFVLFWNPSLYWDFPLCLFLIWTISQPLATYMFSPVSSSLLTLSHVDSFWLHHITLIGTPLWWRPIPTSPTMLKPKDMVGDIGEWMQGNRHSDKLSVIDQSLNEFFHSFDMFYRLVIRWELQNRFWSPPLATFLFVKHIIWDLMVLTSCCSPVLIR